MNSSTGASVFGPSEAAAWHLHAERLEAQKRPVHEWLIDRLCLAPADRALELGCGTAGLGLALRRILGPEGQVICSDISQPMLAAARSRIRTAGAENVMVCRFDAQEIPLRDAHEDGVVCDLALMHMPRPASAVSEARRVLRPGRRLTFSVWGDRGRNPWHGILKKALGRAPAPSAAESRAAGPFALGDPERIRILLSEAGFTEIEVQAIAAPHRYPSMSDWWTTELGLTAERRADFERLSLRARKRARAQAWEHVSRYREPGGGVAVPAEVLVAVGTRP